MARLTKEERIARKAEDAARIARMNAAREEVRAVVRGGVCPQCAAGLRRNLSITGWWQCEQYGAAGFRQHADRPACSWQGFTE